MALLPITRRNSEAATIPPAKPPRGYQCHQTMDLSLC